MSAGARMSGHRTHRGSTSAISWSALLLAGLPLTFLAACGSADPGEPQVEPATAVVEPLEGASGGGEGEGEGGGASGASGGDGAGSAIGDGQAARGDGDAGAVDGTVDGDGDGGGDAGDRAGEGTTDGGADDGGGPGSGGVPGDAVGPGGGAAPDPAAPDPASPGSASGAEARIVRVTAPGCCTGFFWSRDSERLMFIDRPGDGPLGIYTADVGRPAEPPALVTEEIDFYSDDLEYRFELTANDTQIIRVADGERWSVPAGGRPVSISPGGGRIVWQVSPDVVPERRTTTVWIANLDGSEARQVATLPRGSMSGWLGEGAVLIRGREALQSDEDILWRLDVESGERTELARAEQLRGETPSPGGDWIVYYVSRHADPAANGTWIVAGTGGSPRKLDPALFGAYRWRDAGRLLIVPLSSTGPAHALIELDARTLATRTLTDPATTPFKIANGEWSVSPDGRRVAILESADRAIHVIELPLAGD